MVLQKTEKLIQVKLGQQGRMLRVVREHYVREDVPCCSALCLAGCQPQDGVKTLNKDPTLYIVPDVGVTKDLLEILELPEIQGVVFMQTVTNAIQHESGRKHYRRLTNMIKDQWKNAITFCNEFQKYAYCPRQAGESSEQWQSRSIYEGAVWYYNHLAGQIPIVVLTEDKKMKEMYSIKTEGVYVLNMREYLTNFQPKLTNAMDMYEALLETVGQTKNKVSEFSGYLPQDVLSAGLKSGRFVQGRLRVNRHNAQNEATVAPTRVGQKDANLDSDILIHGPAARNRTVNGDQVVVEVLPKSQWRALSNALRENTEETQGDDDDSGGNQTPTGHVVGILQRNWRDYVATVSDDEEGSSSKGKANKILVIPFDWRVPKIRISTAQVHKLKGHRLIVRIDNWEVDSQYPNGHFVRVLGKAGDLETEISSILVENDISVGGFSEGIMKELPSNTWDSPWLMEAEEVKRRRDLRQSHLVFSIDPKGCEDVDDTLSVRKLPNGRLELGVHIADVTHFVKPGSLTDLEARARSTTVYLSDRRYDMLPEVLSADLCSLLSGVDRYAMSVIWELDEKCEVKDVWYGRTVIRSAYKLFYEMAQEIFDGADEKTIVKNVPELSGCEGQELQDKITELRWAIGTLMKTARKIKSKRTVGGALSLESVEVQIQLDKDKTSIQDLVPKQPLEVHETIAECMIFANHWVAKKICEAFPSQALLRHHPLPRQEHFGTLVTCAKAKGFSIDTRTNKTLADSLDDCVDPNDPNVNKLLRSLATQAMSNASYFSTGSLARDQFFHYGLALDYYTHFTSPIRRYADVIVHRLLMAALKQEGTSGLFGNKDLEEVANHINNKHRASQHAQKDSLELFQTMFFQDENIGGENLTCDGVVFQLRDNGLIVFVPRYGIKGAVYLRSREGQVVYLTSDGTPEWTSGSLVKSEYAVVVNSVMGAQRYRLFQHITVRIVVRSSHAHSSNIKLELVSNKACISLPDQPSYKEQKEHIIKMVTEGTSNDDDTDDTVSLGPNFSKLKSEYGQTDDNASLYSLFQSLRTEAQLDGSTSQEEAQYFIMQKT